MFAIIASAIGVSVLTTICTIGILVVLVPIIIILYIIKAIERSCKGE
jgi:hypothetical protein